MTIGCIIIVTGESDKKSGKMGFIKWKEMFLLLSQSVFCQPFLRTGMDHVLQKEP